VEIELVAILPDVLDSLLWREPFFPEFVCFLCLQLVKVNIIQDGIGLKLSIQFVGDCKRFTVALMDCYPFVPAYRPMRLAYYLDGFRLSAQCLEHARKVGSLQYVTVAILADSCGIVFWP